MSKVEQILKGSPGPPGPPSSLIDDDLTLIFLDILEGSKTKTRKSQGLLLSCTQVNSSLLQIIATQSKIMLQELFGPIDSNRLCQSVINLLKELEKCKANVKIFFMVD